MTAPHCSHECVCYLYPDKPISKHSRPCPGNCHGENDTRTLPQPQPVPDCSHCIHDKTKVRYEPTNGITFCVHRVSGKCVFAAAPQPPATGALDDHTLLKLAGTAWFNRDQESDPARPNNNGSWWRFGWAQGYKAATIRSQQGGKQK